MRYISINPGLTLYTVKGQARHQFLNGELIIGDSTTRDGSSATGTATSGYVVDAFSHGTTEYYGDLTNMRVLDLNGAIADTYASRVERAGMGTLTLSTITGATLGSLQSGWGSFFESPIQTSTASSGVSLASAPSGAWYQVQTGSLTYGTSTYRIGQVFMGDGTGAVSGAGTFAQTLLPEWVDACNPYLDEAFRMRHTHQSDDFQGYYDKSSPAGYTPRNSNDPTSDDFHGYISNL